MDKKTLKKAESQSVKTINVCELSNMARKIAEAVIKRDGVYFAIIDGIKTRVIS